jgi:hypothetical protein
VSTATDPAGYMRPGSDPRDGDLDGRARQALRNENCGTEARRAEVVARRAAAVIVKGKGR